MILCLPATLGHRNLRRCSHRNHYLYHHYNSLLDYFQKLDMVGFHCHLPYLHHLHNNCGLIRQDPTKHVLHLHKFFDKYHILYKANYIHLFQNHNHHQHYHTILLLQDE